MKEFYAKLYAKITNFDLYLHLIVGTATMLLFLHYELLVPGTLAVVTMARLKEVYDRSRPDHTYDGWDAYATCLGIPAGLLLYPLLESTVLKYLSTILA